MKRRMLVTLCVGLALSAGSLVSLQSPVSAGNKSSGRALKFETTAMGASLKVKARGTAEGATSAEKVHVDIESKMLGPGATVTVYALKPGSNDLPRMIGSVTLEKDAADPNAVRGALDWNRTAEFDQLELRVTNSNDASMIYAVAR